MKTSFQLFFFLGHCLFRRLESPAGTFPGEPSSRVQWLWSTRHHWHTSDFLSCSEATIYGLIPVQPLSPVWLKPARPLFLRCIFLSKFWPGFDNQRLDRAWTPAEQPMHTGELTEMCDGQPTSSPGRRLVLYFSFWTATLGPLMGHKAGPD